MRSRLSYVPQPMGSNFRPQKLAGYYTDFSAKALRHQGCLETLMSTAQPVNVAQACLGFHEMWLSTAREEDLERSVQLANWLVTHQKDGCWEFEFNWYYGLRPPWISAMAQGEGISALLRVHRITKDDRYLTAAQAAITPFRQEIKEGGVRMTLSNGDVFFEEYPSDPPSHVLNGFIFALWGLYDYAHYLEDSEAEGLFQKGVQTLMDWLPKYDLGYWSTYDLFPFGVRFVAHPFYHQLHIVQLKVLSLLTGQLPFREMAVLWESYRQRWSCRCRRAGHAALFKMYSRSDKMGRISREKYVEGFISCPS